MGEEPKYISHKVIYVWKNARLGCRCTNVKGCGKKFRNRFYRCEAVNEEAEIVAKELNPCDKIESDVPDTFDRVLEPRGLLKSSQYSKIKNGLRIIDGVNDNDVCISLGTISSLSDLLAED